MYLKITGNKETGFVVSASWDKDFENAHILMLDSRKQVASYVKRAIKQAN